MAADSYDTQFTMPALDHPATTEIGVILSGLDIDRLLAGLGAAADADDPAAVTLLVDRLRHGDSDEMAAAVDAGARRWRAVRDTLAAVEPAVTVSASIRQAWQRALRAVQTAGLGPDIGSAGHTYLAACWLRRKEVDRAVR